MFRSRAINRFIFFPGSSAHRQRGRQVFSIPCPLFGVWAPCTSLDLRSNDDDLADVVMPKGVCSVDQGPSVQDARKTTASILPAHSVPLPQRRDAQSYPVFSGNLTLPLRTPLRSASQSIIYGVTKTVTRSVKVLVFSSVKQWELIKLSVE